MMAVMIPLSTAVKVEVEVAVVPNLDLVALLLFLLPPFPFLMALATRALLGSATPGRKCHAQPPGRPPPLPTRVNG